MAFSKLKALLRKAAARSVDELWTVIAECLDSFTPTECRNYFKADGYDPEWIETALGPTRQSRDDFEIYDGNIRAKFVLDKYLKSIAVS